MKLHFLIQRRTSPSEIVTGVADLLRRRGFGVECSIAEEELLALDKEPDCGLYLLKSYTPLALSVAGFLSLRRAPLINSYVGCCWARNKVLAWEVLRSAGLPVPCSWVTQDLDCVRELVSRYPVILKPYFGWRGEGVTIAQDERQLAAMAEPKQPLLVQEFLRGSGEDVRLYVAGDEVFAVRKRFSADSFSMPGRLVPVTREWRRLAVRCGAIFGFALYGIDLVETERGPLIVDVNYFPGYKGVPGATGAVADVIAQHATGIRSLPRPRAGDFMEAAG